MVFKIKSMGLLGIEAFKVDVECDISGGMPCFDVVGLPDASIKESRNRVRSSLKNCGFKFPVSRITVNLAPADTKKEGPFYDLPILLSLLFASGQVDSANFDVESSAFIGELSLNGQIHAVNGILPMVIKAQELGFKNIFIPLQNAVEGAAVRGIDVYPVGHISSLINHISGQKKIQPQPQTVIFRVSNAHTPDFADVKGQQGAKRALEIAAAGGHNVLLIGAPGSGKSMLAKRVPSILPDMTFCEIIETTKIHSIVGALDKNDPLITTRPFRTPHHTVSPAGLSGGGGIPHPGEISLAHNGVLFLDELPEFARNTMEILRQPIEDGKVTIARVRTTLTYPCSVILIAAMNPCPCGYFNHPHKSCTCSQNAISRYLAKVSGPLLDRLDLHIEVPPVSYDNISSQSRAESSETIKERVNSARSIQNDRYKGFDMTCNAKLAPEFLRKFCVLTDAAQNLLKLAFDKMGLSARAYDRILKVSRTIADLEQSEKIHSCHVSEAIHYRSLDKKYWFR